MGYIVAAYAVIWLLIFIYTLVLGNRQKNLAKEVEMLQEAVKER